MSIRFGDEAILTKRTANIREDYATGKIYKDGKQISEDYIYNMGQDTKRNLLQNEKCRVKPMNFLIDKILWRQDF